MATTTTDKVVVGAAAVAVTGAVLAASGAFSPRTISTADLSDAEIARFLAQCTFGATEADIAAVRAAGSLNAWLDQQIAMTPFSMLAAVRKRLTQSKPYRVEGHGAFVEQFWIRAITGGDQLRQRMQFALSQICVVSRENDTLMFGGTTATTAYYDLLGANAFGNWRTLIEKVTLNPIVGIFLNFITNEKENPATGTNPDENYAREVMQLFSIGTIQLNPDGTAALVNNATVPTYTHDDIIGLARVFTGFSWYSPGPDEGTWLSSAYGFFDQGGENGNPSQMIPYPTHHSTSQKSFLGQTIPATAPLKKTDTAAVMADLKVALDTLFNHPNCAPYFAKRLIQQFVTSNPSPGYVGRVAAVFADNGSGVRGDLAAVLKAVLLDDEARNTAAAVANPIQGKLIEPVIRVTNWARAFSATSKRGFYSIGETGTADSLSEAVLDAPSVFNFWRATYVPPMTLMGAQTNPLNTTIQGLTVPEFQVVSELTVAAYANLVIDMVGTGIGVDQVKFTGIDVSSAYVSEVAIADDANKLVDRVNLLLMRGQISATLRQQIVNAVNGVAIPTGSTATDAKIAAAKLNRAKLAITLAMVSPEYLTLS